MSTHNCTAAEKEATLLEVFEWANIAPSLTITLVTRWATKALFPKPLLDHNAKDTSRLNPIPKP